MTRLLLRMIIGWHRAEAYLARQRGDYLEAAQCEADAMEIEGELLRREINHA